MKLQRIAVLALAASVFLFSPLVYAEDPADAAPRVSEQDLKPNLPQPYIVKKGDTLWDIAKYFFKDPEKWIKIWEKNLYITNPDLIYPGNKIWFDARKQKQGGLSRVRPVPTVLIKPVERLETGIDPAILLTALKRQDFIRPNEIQGVGHILDSRDERLNYGAGDRLYLKLDKPAAPGDVFDVFRTGDPVRDPRTGKLMGFLINHLGQIEITSRADGTYRGVVRVAYEELSRGDRLKPAREIDPHLRPSYPNASLSGVVMYIRNDAAEAGQNQVVGISLGLKDGIKPGSILSVHRAGRVVRDSVTGKKERLPEEKIGEILVLAPQDAGSIALVTESVSSINIGDAVHNQARR